MRKCTTVTWQWRRVHRTRPSVRLTALANVSLAETWPETLTWVRDHLQQFPSSVQLRLISGHHRLQVSEQMFVSRGQQPPLERSFQVLERGHFTHEPPVLSVFTDPQPAGNSTCSFRSVHGLHNKRTKQIQCTVAQRNLNGSDCVHSASSLSYCTLSILILLHTCTLVYYIKKSILFYFAVLCFHIMTLICTNNVIIKIKIYLRNEAQRQRNQTKPFYIYWENKRTRSTF